MRVLLTVLAALLYAVGWVAGRVWLVLAWLGTAILVGWRDAIRPRVSPVVPESPIAVPAYPAPQSRRGVQVIKTHGLADDYVPPSTSMAG